VEHWVASGNVSNELLSFVHGVNLETERIFVYTHTHAGSEMDDPTVKASLKDGLLDVTWFDERRSDMRTHDLRFQPLVVAIRLDTDAVKSVHVHGLVKLWMVDVASTMSIGGYFLSRDIACCCAKTIWDSAADRADRINIPEPIESTP
jgi:hypothetical protein